MPKFCLCVFFRVIPYRRRKTHKQNSPQNRGTTPVKILFTCFFSLCVCVFFFCSLIWGQTITKINFLRIGNGVGKQGRGNQPAYRRYGPDTEIQYRPREPHALAKTSRILSKRAADTEFQYRPHIVDSIIRTPIADAIFSEAISDTPKFHESLPFVDRHLGKTG